MAGPIADEFDLLTIRAAIRTRPLGIKNIAQSVNDLDVRLFAAPAYIIGFADASPIEHSANRGAVIGDIKPISALLAVAIDRQWHTSQPMMNRQGNEFFRKLIGPVIVRAVGDQHRKPIGVAPSADKMIGRRLARRVRAVRLITIGLSKSRLILAEGAKNLIGRDM